MRQKYLNGIAPTLLLFFFLSGTPAFGLTITYEDGVINETDGLKNYKTYGDTMDGMTVTAVFTDGRSETVLWRDAGTQSGGAFADDWYAFESGDTFYYGLWSISNQGEAGISEILFDGGTGDTVFDILYQTPDGRHEAGTLDSAYGWPFEIRSASGELDIAVTYFDLVGLTDTEPVGDLYRRMKITFLNEGGFRSGNYLSFVTDTDNLKYPGDIKPIPHSPEPAAYLLLGLGLMGIAFIRRRGSRG